MLYISQLSLSSVTSLLIVDVGYTRKISPAAVKGAITMSPTNGKLYNIPGESGSLFPRQVYLPIKTSVSITEAI